MDLSLSVRVWRPVLSNSFPARLLSSEETPPGTISAVVPSAQTRVRRGLAEKKRTVKSSLYVHSACSCKPKRVREDDWRLLSFRLQSSANTPRDGTRLSTWDCTSVEAPKGEYTPTHMLSLCLSRFLSFRPSSLSLCLVCASLKRTFALERRKKKKKSLSW